MRGEREGSYEAKGKDMEEPMKRKHLSAASRCDIGLMRAMNQDRVYASTEPVGLLPNLFIVADGMGGHKAGDLASTEATRYFIEYIEAHSGESSNILELMKAALSMANRFVYYLSKKSPDYEGMGTTFVAATVCGDMLYCINVGDSRLYEICEAGTHPMTLRQVTDDHSVVNMLMKEGVITAEEAKVHTSRNMVTRAIGIDETVEIDEFTLDLSSIHRLLLCSDGLTNMLEDIEILSEITAKEDIEDVADTLVRSANEKGGRDNISVIVIDLSGEVTEDA